MKTRMFLKYTVLASGLLCATAFQALGQAEGAGAGGGRRGGPALLTQEQRTKMREAMQDSRTELTALNEKLAAAEKEAVKAALAENPDEKTVRAKIEAVTKLQTEVMMLRFKAVKAIAPTLTSEQKSQLENAPRGGFMALFQMMGGPGRGPRGGGGGGGSNN